MDYKSDWRTLILQHFSLVQAYDDLSRAEQAGTIRYSELIKLHHFFRHGFREGLDAMQREFATETYESWHRPRIPTSINLWMTGPIERALNRMDSRDPRYLIFASFVNEVLGTKARVARLKVIPPVKRVEAARGMSQSGGAET